MIKLAVNPRLNKPIYDQIYTQIVSQIVGGGVSPDEMLPSIRAVALELNISVITVKNAYEKLEADGYIYTRAGKGCFVSPKTDGGDMRLSVARDKLKQDLQYYKLMGLTEEELISLIREEYGEV